MLLVLFTILEFMILFFFSKFLRLKIFFENKEFKILGRLTR